MRKRKASKNKTFPSKWDGLGYFNAFAVVVMPQATTGHCRNYLKCKQFNVELANGYCITCWDTERDIKDARREARKRSGKVRTVYGKT